MHSTRTATATFFHHGDFSGRIHFVTAAARPRHPDRAAVFAGVEVTTSFADLAAVVAASEPDLPDTTPVAVPAEAQQDGAGPGPGADGVLRTGTACTAELLLGDVRALVAARVRDERIAFLERADDRALCALARDAELLGWASPDRPG